MKHPTFQSAPALILLAALLSCAPGGWAQQYRVTQFTTLGEGSPLAAGQYRLDSSSGEADARQMSGGSYSVDVGFWRIATDLEVLTGGPHITSAPQNQTVPAGGNAVFRVGAIGALPLSYQWLLDGAILSGATNASYTVSNALPADGATGVLLYSVEVSNAFGSVISPTAGLTVGLPPSISDQPQSQLKAPAQNASFLVGALGDAPLSYEWRYNGRPLTGFLLNGSTYTVPNVSWASAGSYDVVITNSAGSVTSQVAVLTVTDTNWPVINAPATLVVPCTSPAGAIVSLPFTVQDPYDNSPILTCAPASGSQFPMGKTTVTCVAKDVLGNTRTNLCVVQVAGTCDAGYIALNCPSNVQVALGSLSAVPVPFTATATNTFTHQPYPVYCTPPSGSSFPLGTNIVTCVGSAGGASNVCTFTVVVNNPAPPVLRVPRDIFTVSQAAAPAGQSGAYVHFQINVLDFANLGTVLSVNPPSGSLFNVGTNVVSLLIRDLLGNLSTAQFNIVVAPFTSEGASDPNWGFENQFNLGEWTATGNAFNFQPVVGDFFTVKRIPQLQQQMQAAIGGDYWSNILYSVGQRGQRWICSAGVPDTGPAGGLDDLYNDSLTGTLYSASFAIAQNYISFLIGGGQDDANLRVELLVQTTPNNTGPVINGTTYYVFDHRSGLGQELMRRDWFNVSSLIGQQARLRIVDTSATGHVNVDDFQFTNTVPTAQTVNIGGSNYPSVVLFNSYYYDWDSPVWGFADMHTHPMSYLGFGQKLMHGSPDGGAADPSDFSQALANCNCDHGGYDFLNNTCGDYFRQLIMLAMDPGGNDPHGAGWDANPTNQFRKWPVFSTLSHQQMWFDWMRRTYNGGQRVVVALCVNNELLATVSKGVDGAPHYDLPVGDLQISELKNFVGRHSDFMEIAYDPFQLRDIVRRDKLAIVIGSELDDIGNLVHDPGVTSQTDNTGQINAYSRQQVQAAIQHLYTNGVRYIFTVHLSNNKFGGSPIADTLLDIASKFLNGQGEVESPAAPSDLIAYRLDDMNFLDNIPASAQTFIDVSPLLGPLLLPAIQPELDAVISSLAPVPPGAGSGIAAGLLPIIAMTAFAAENDPNTLFAALLALFGVDTADIQTIINQQILPVGHNYPASLTTNQAPHGVINAAGLSPLGTYAVKQMMSLGMMLDADHLSQHTFSDVAAIATNIPGGYPLNSGHNSFRELSLDANENHRSPSQLETIRQLGGLMGVGWENAASGSYTRAFSDLVAQPQYSSSRIANDCAGTSKTWGQLYLYALEKLQGQNVAFGTDTDGMIQFPGPRFGPQSDYGLDGVTNLSLRSPHIRAQGASGPDGVLYTQTEGNPLMTAAFWGRAVDPGLSSLGSLLPGNDFVTPDNSQGYEYNADQARFFAAINLFYGELAAMTPGESQDSVNSDLEAFQSYLSEDYPNVRHIKEYAFGLVDGFMNWDTGTDFGDGDVGTLQQLGKSIYLSQVAHSSPLSDVTGDPEKLARYNTLLVVWSHYHRAFGTNAPLIRCQTGAYKQWDINFEGLAHYGLIPDFLQDLSNVGLQAQDMSVLFHSAEGFAQMWVKSLIGSYAFRPHFSGHVLTGVSGDVFFDLVVDDASPIVLQETTDLKNWQGANVLDISTNGFTRTVHVPTDGAVKFYRFYPL